jgi:hypothetical protein
MVMALSEVASENAEFPMDVTLDGMVIEARAVAPANEDVPIVVSRLPFEKVTVASADVPSNA